MLKRFDHVTLVVRDLERAKRFFGELGFEEATSVVISGDEFSRYMGVPGIEADHVTLALKGASPRVEVQLLRYRRPEAIADPDITRLDKVGFNHVCFAVDNLEGQLAKLRAAGIETRSDVMRFHGRKLVFLSGPEGVTVELSEWTQTA